MDKELTVLVMDDAEVVRGLLAAMLMEFSSVGCVIQAQDAGSALRLVAEHEPDIAILDIAVPGDGVVRDGIGVLRWIKQHYPRTRVLMLSNYATQYFRSESRRAGADGFFDKSSEFDALLDCITEYDGKLEATN